jgi:lysophospholipase L1-like esterase
MPDLACQPLNLQCILGVHRGLPSGHTMDDAIRHKESSLMPFSHVWLLLATLTSAPLFARSQAASLPANAEEADFAQLHHYRAQNATHTPAHARRVVFLGDSITEYWGLHSGTWFEQPEWLNRGIGGQTTQQLLLRERNDALDLHPRAIVIEAGSNDMRLGFSPEAIRDNIASIAELAHAHRVTVFITGMTPVCDCVRPLTGLRTVERIHHLNALLQQLCREQHWTYLDFNTPLTGPGGFMRRELTVDGVHPNSDGYKLLEPVVFEALRDYRK